MTSDAEELIAATMCGATAWIITGPDAETFMKEMVVVLIAGGYKVFAGPAFDRPGARIVVVGFALEDAAKCFVDYERSGRADHEIRIGKYVAAVPALSPSKSKRA